MNKQRYFRKVIAHPDGAILHHGDCLIFTYKICSCGLLHDLSALETEEIKELYPKYFDEDAAQCKVIDILLKDLTSS